MHVQVVRLRRNRLFRCLYSSKCQKQARFEPTGRFRATAPQHARQLLWQHALASYTSQQALPLRMPPAVPPQTPQTSAPVAGPSVMSLVPAPTGHGQAPAGRVSVRTVGAPFCVRASSQTASDRDEIAVPDLERVR